LASFLDSNRRQQSENGHKTTQLLPRAESSSHRGRGKTVDIRPHHLEEQILAWLCFLSASWRESPMWPTANPEFFCCQKVLTKHVVSAQNFCPNDLGLS